MVNIFVKTIISASMNTKHLLLLLFLISQFSFSNNTDFLTNDSIDKNDDVYFLMLVDELKRIVLPHSGIHANFSTYYYHIVRELIAQGYIVVSAEYRGSTGYGKTTYENIDYGGRENDDVLKSRDYMVDNYSIVDSTRVGVIGWSHGGMIALMQILQHGGSYKCAFAGVPVSDLEIRLETHDDTYSAYFTAPHHIGESIESNRDEYVRRSPTHYASNLNKPLLIYTNTNDNDVYVEEVQTAGRLPIFDIQYTNS